MGVCNPSYCPLLFPGEVLVAPGFVLTAAGATFLGDSPAGCDRQPRVSCSCTVSHMQLLPRTGFLYGRSDGSRSTASLGTVAHIARTERPRRVR